MPLSAVLDLRGTQRWVLHREGRNGLAIAYFYYEQEPGRRTAANLMTKDEARRIAANIVKLTGLLKRSA